MDTAPAMQLVLFREADLAAIPERRRLRVKIHFTDECEIARRPGEFASAARNVRGITGEREARLRERNSGGHRRIEVNVIAGFGNPVMLNVEEDCAVWTR